jgi:glutamyl-tRNA reductase
MSEKQRKVFTATDKTGEQVPRRSFISKGVIGVGAVAFAGSALGQTQRPVEPEAGRVKRDGRFANKVVLITGATSGIGEGTAHAFAKEGAKVCFCGRRENLGRQVEAKIKASAVKRPTFAQMYAELKM